jgi:hypothetical protein
MSAVRVKVNDSLDKIEKETVGLINIVKIASHRRPWAVVAPISFVIGLCVGLI